MVIVSFRWYRVPQLNRLWNYFGLHDVVMTESVQFSQLLIWFKATELWTRSFSTARGLGLMPVNCVFTLSTINNTLVRINLSMNFRARRVSRILICASSLLEYGTLQGSGCLFLRLYFVLFVQSKVPGTYLILQFVRGAVRFRCTGICFLDYLSRYVLLHE